MKINKAEIETTIQLINLLCKISQIKFMSINGEHIHYEPKAITQSEFLQDDIIIVIDYAGRNWFYSIDNIETITIQLQNNQIL